MWVIFTLIMQCTPFSLSSSAVLQEPNHASATMHFPLPNHLQANLRVVEWSIQTQQRTPFWSPLPSLLLGPCLAKCLTRHRRWSSLGCQVGGASSVCRRCGLRWRLPRTSWTRPRTVLSQPTTAHSKFVCTTASSPALSTSGLRADRLLPHQAAALQAPPRVGKICSPNQG